MGYHTIMVQTMVPTATPSLFFPNTVLLTFPNMAAEALGATGKVGDVDSTDGLVSVISRRTKVAGDGLRAQAANVPGLNGRVTSCR